MTTIPSEDAQPNELRPARKGSNIVPTVRSIRPTNARGSFRGFRGTRGGRGRAKPPFPKGSAAPGYSRSEVTPVSSTQAGPSGPAWRRNEDHTNKRSSSSVEPEGARLLKQPRLDGVYPNGNSHFAAQGAPAQQQKKANTAEEKEIIIVELPDSCKPGAYACKRHRRQWISKELPILVAQRNVKVLCYNYVDNAIRLECQRIHDQNGLPAIHPAPCCPSQPIASSSRSQESSRTKTGPLKSSENIQNHGSEAFVDKVPLVNDEPSLRASPNLPAVLADEKKTALHHGNAGLASHSWSIESDQDIAEVQNVQATPTLSQSHDCRSSTNDATSRLDNPRGISPMRIVEREMIDLSDELDDGTGTSNPRDVGAANSTPTIHRYGAPPSRSTPSSSAVSQASFACFSFRSGTCHVRRTDESDQIDTEPSSSTPRDLHAAHATSVMYADSTNAFGPEPMGALSSSMPSAAEHANLQLEYPSSDNEAGCTDTEPMHHARTESGSGSFVRSRFGIEPPEEVVRAAREKYEKPRCVLSGSDLGLITVTSRGSVECTDRLLPRQHRIIAAGSKVSQELVDDACILPCATGTFVILGNTRNDRQLSVLQTKDGKTAEVRNFDRPVSNKIKDRKEGISAVCAMLIARMFATGGYDHRVHLWTIPQDAARTSCQFLAIHHTALVQSLLPIRDTSHKLVSAGADCTVNLWDLSSERVVNTLKTSNSVYHVHPAISPFCTLSEVAHRDMQFEIRDHRLVPEHPVQRFGYSTSRFRGRYVRGSVRSFLFACGDRDGCVRIWDMRQTKQACDIVECFPGRRITQVEFDRLHLVACSEDLHLAFMKLSAS